MLATVAAARHLGYRRTGANFRAAVKSAINAAIRRRLVERDGAEMVRKRSTKYEARNTGRPAEGAALPRRRWRDATRGASGPQCGSHSRSEWATLGTGANRRAAERRPVLDDGKASSDCYIETGVTAAERRN
jgi:hypothetical protein